MLCRMHTVIKRKRQSKKYYTVCLFLCVSITFWPDYSTREKPHVSTSGEPECTLNFMPIYRVIYMFCKNENCGLMMMQADIKTIIN